MALTFKPDGSIDFQAMYMNGGIGGAVPGQAGYAPQLGGGVPELLNPNAAPSPEFMAPQMTEALAGGLPAGAAGGMDFGGLFDKLGGAQGIGSLAKGAGGLMSAWNGYQSNKLAKEQFKTATAFANRNLANNAAVTNQSLRDRRSGRRAIFGGNKGTGAQVNGAPV